MPAIIDTNVFVGSILIDADFHYKVKELLEKVDEWSYR